MPSRMIALACVAIATLAPHQAAAQSGIPPYEAELTREATLFFADVLPDLDRGYGPCTFSAEWARYPVLAELFDVPVHGNLVPPDHRTQPAEILDPAGHRPGWLCDDAEIDTLVAEATQRVELDGGTVEVRGYELTFPIFSEDFDRAVIVVIDWQISLFFLPEGEDRMLVRSRTGGGRALIYERRDDHWTLLSSHDLFAYH